jgi:Tetracyclin repressor-like, C-terminal domain
MAVYRHAMDKDILLDGLVERVISHFVVPRQAVQSADLDWAAALRESAHRFRRAALAHPKILPTMVTRSLSGPLALRPPGMLRPLEDLLELFTGAGFDQHGALHAARLYTGYLYQQHRSSDTSALNLRRVAQGMSNVQAERAAQGPAPEADGPHVPRSASQRAEQGVAVGEKVGADGQWLGR